ncbi:hypothetical protein GMAR_ORF284 [Golden Marseillevirus]|uniref:hypothetical protein n=1 Tax=Golden Marseillevirus TaxID=1720526 RepID=UPI000877AF2F|nr:hypothetical protein GMAR_ORF284 [Golden Marseillevirus]ALX27658.1 hypothetical protein GMAR_ORF284 [Golden Marseillevirus]
MATFEILSFREKIIKKEKKCRYFIVMSIDDVMPEIFALYVFSEVDNATFYALPFVCKRWKSIFPKRKGVEPSSSTIAAAGKNLLSWALSHGCQWKKKTLEVAASMGDVEYIEWMVENGCPEGDYFFVANEAAIKGKIQVLEWLFATKMSIKEKWDYMLVVQAAAGGQLETLQWLREKPCMHFWDMVHIEASDKGHLDVLKWAEANGLCEEDLDWCMACAVKSGRKKIVSYLIDMGEQVNEHTMRQAVGAGKLGTVKFLRQKGCAWDSDCVMLAKTKGFSDILEWLVKNGCASPMVRIKITYTKTMLFR